MATRAELVALLRECREFVRGPANAKAMDLSSRIDAALAEPEAGKTVRVRAAVAIDESGCWHINGDDTYDDETSSRHAVHYNDTPARSSIYFITASVPLPQAVEVEGKVCDEK